MVSSPVAETTNSKTRGKQLIALVWAPEENRTATFAHFLNAPLYYVHYLLYKRPYVAPFKYVAQAIKTWLILYQQRPKLVYVTNPPVFAALSVYLFCLFSSTRYIMDTHSPVLFSRRWGWSLPITRFLAKRAYLNVVDQARFKTLFESWGGTAVILPKPPKNPHSIDLKQMSDPSKFEITVINTFAEDEPLTIILDAARSLPDVRFYILGDKNLANPHDLNNAPPNVVFTGYLLGDDYWNRLYSSRAVMALTTFPHSLLAGSQDGATLGKPLLLSRQPALVEFYPKGAVFIENTAEGIVAGVKDVMAREDQLIKDVVDVVELQAKEWDQNFQSLVRKIEAVE